MKQNEEDRKQVYFKQVYDNIKNIGYHTTAIMEEENFTPFTYSTGLFENFKIPELFISGLGPNLSGEIIKNYAEKYKNKTVPVYKKIDDLIDTFPIYFIKVNNHDLAKYALTSIKFYENSYYEYLQLVFPDLNGNFPNESTYNYDQEIIGEFTI
ncbi:hypothetical protein L1276_002478 [Flavobacterium sp. HSC-32F16]|uniref:DUF4262 domain-containing protein n=1 Tax=Flavobacterium sp. HSC-32F16 TaxID=2910964 RepID=UPI0020A4A636|nr:DUF4262 domain-containing protein [Flavobacterium sp. HSC-32F16]MCP2027321.1 hypothetical protein [Flavobacterium sp. HSC-32F16]